MAPSSKLKDADFPVTAFKDQPLDHPKIQVLRILAREYSEKFRSGTELEKLRIVELIVDVVKPGEGGCCRWKKKNGRGWKRTATGYEHQEDVVVENSVRYALLAVSRSGGKDKCKLPNVIRLPTMSKLSKAPDAMSASAIEWTPPKIITCHEDAQLQPEPTGLEETLSAAAANTKNAESRSKGDTSTWSSSINSSLSSIDASPSSLDDSHAPVREISLRRKSHRQKLTVKVMHQPPDASGAMDICTADSTQKSPLVLEFSSDDDMSEYSC